MAYRDTFILAVHVDAFMSDVSILIISTMPNIYNWDNKKFVCVGS